jgi:hypothetical protein
MLAIMLPSHANDDAAGVTWLQRDVDVKSCWRQNCRVMLATTLPGRLGRDVMKMSNHVGDGAVEAT